MGIESAVVSGLISAGLGALPGLFGGGDKETGTQKSQRKLIDQLLAGLQGSGPFANLFAGDDAAFKKSVSDPLLQQFREGTAPQIQQKFISQGQQRGTPLESALTRAGTDVQSQIDQLFLPFQQGQQNRAQSAIQSILGFQGPQQQSGFNPLLGALTGLSAFGAGGGFSGLFGGGSSSGVKSGGISRRGF